MQDIVSDYVHCDCVVQARHFTAFNGILLESVKH
jgi:hypothetical protein